MEPHENKSNETSSSSNGDKRSYSNWMEKLPNEKQLCPLNKITVPGSHDSGAFWLDEDMGLAPDRPKFVANISQKLGLLDSTIKSYVKKWAMTQSLNIAEQLSAGVRYFDFRIAYRKESDEFRVVHSLYGSEVEGILEEIKLFLRENSKEVVLLDFNHLYDMEVEEHLRLGSLINQCFGQMLHSPRKDLSIASLQELWLAGEQVIVFYHNKDIIEMFPSFFGNASISSDWPNTDDLNKLTHHVSSQGLASKAANLFHVTQAIATPQPSTIFRNLWGSLKSSLSCKTNENVNSLLESNHNNYSFNVILVDHVAFDDLMSNIISYNYIY